jgi:pimeloyl-ACP methyl ester carboxylesterase
MKCWVKVVLGAAGALIVAAAVIWFAAPGLVVKAYTAVEMRKAGLSEKSTKAGDHVIHYLEGGGGEHVVLLHGFGANKAHWLSFSRYMTPGYHVVIPDLPGFGQSSYDRTGDYSHTAQAVRIKAFADAVGLKKFHLVGNSMGGNIAGNFAAEYPHMVASLALFDASGVKSAEKSERDILREKEINIFAVSNADEYDRLVNLAFVKPIYLPGPVKKILMEQAIERRPVIERISKQLTADYYALEDKLSRITARTLILWGDTDRLIHIACLKIFERKIKNSTIKIIKDCGHIPMVERPKETTDLYLEFLKVGNR